MKKIIIIIVIVVLIITLLKNFTTTKYSHDDIIALIKKGMQNMDNVSFDSEDEIETVHYYFKGNNKKMVSSNIITITLENKKTYMIDQMAKIIGYSMGSSYRVTGVQADALSIEEMNKELTPEDNFRYEFVYIKDEKIENKNCIFVKKCRFYTDTNKYNDYIDYSYSPKVKVPVYWIEKSTGFVIGTGLMKPGKNKAKPQTIIKNMKFGEVTDDVFELPTDYFMFEND